MAYHVVISDYAVKKLKKPDKSIAALIFGYIEKNLEGCSDPRQHGKALTADHKGKWRYRVGDYRILVLIEDDRILITLIDVGHRKDVYE